MSPDAAGAASVEPRSPTISGDTVGRRSKPQSAASACGAQLQQLVPEQFHSPKYAAKASAGSDCGLDVPKVRLGSRWRSAWSRCIDAAAPKTLAGETPVASRAILRFFFHGALGFRAPSTASSDISSLAALPMAFPTCLALSPILGKEWRPTARRRPWRLLEWPVLERYTGRQQEYRQQGGIMVAGPKVRHNTGTAAQGDCPCAVPRNGDALP